MKWRMWRVDRQLLIPIILVRTHRDYMDTPYVLYYLPLDNAKSSSSSDAACSLGSPGPGVVVS